MARVGCVLASGTRGAELDTYYARSNQTRVVSGGELGPLEMRVLGLLDGAGASPVQAIQELLRRSGSDLAYTTVMTVLVRLHEKGLVVRTKEGRRYLYSLGRRAPSVTQGIVARIQKTLFQRDRTRPILALLDDEELSEEELLALRRKIDDRLRGKP